MTANGYIVDASDDDCVAIIPAPPSAEEVDSVNQSQGGGNSAIASIGSSLPSRDSVSAAIALVRAKQVAKSAILRLEEQASVATGSSSAWKENVTIISEIDENENSAQIVSTNNKARIDSTQKDSSDFSSSVKEGASLSSELQQPCSSSASLPQGPSFEQTSVTGEASTTADSSSNAIPAPPSFESGDRGYDGTGDANTLDDVNALLSRLGVGALHSLSNDSNNSIDRLRMICSSPNGASSDHSETRGSSALEIQPETLEEISAIIDAVREEHLGKQVVREQSDPPGPSPSPETDTDTHHSKEENPFIDNSYSEQSLESNRVEDEKKVDDSNEKKVPNMEVESRFGDESFAADVRKTLSTVKEVASMEVDDDDDSTKDDHESDKYVVDGGKEPKGVYEKAEVEVEKIPVSDVGVEVALKNSMSLMSINSQQVGTDRYAIGHNETQNKNKESENVQANDTASVLTDNGSLPWAIRDVASEETLRATGRRRPHFIVSGPRPSQKSRNVASLFDDISQQGSETASEFRSGLSFLDDTNENNDDGPTSTSEDKEIEISDSAEADRGCMVDHFLYNKYEPENDYQIQGGKSSAEQSDKPIAEDNVGKGSSDSCDTGEVQATDQDQSEEVNNLLLRKDPSAEMQIKDAEEDAEEKEESNPFLRQFEDLDLDDDSDDDKDDNKNDDKDDVVQVGNNPVLMPQVDPRRNTAEEMSPEKLAKYFSNIDQRKFEGEKEEKLTKEFKRLMMPVINGNIPTIIEEAQIRQAALKADVSLNVVDAFVDFVKDEKLEIAPQLSKQSSKSEEKDFLSKGWEDIEDLDEDDAIAAFLSSKSDAQDLKTEDTSKIAEETSKADADLKKKEEELAGASSRDYQSSVTSTFDPESDFNESKDSEVEADGSEDENDDSDATEVETNADNGNNEEKSPADETKKIPIHIPKDVKSGSRDETETDLLVDTEMLKACEKIQGYDEGVWHRRAAMATHGWEWEERTWLTSPKSSSGAAFFSTTGIHGVSELRDASNYMFNRRSFPLSRKHCKLSYNRRVKAHTGYFDVDMFSLQESATSGEENMYKDETPWELRNVRQRFLHERSLTFSRNWFGDLVKTSGNDKIKAPICKPKSMEMPMPKIPDPGDWTPEWYTTWGGRKLMLRRPSFDSSVDSRADSYTENDLNDGDSLRSYSSAGSSFEDDEDWEEAPECGTFVNTKLKIGEHVSRVHPDFTSSLRKSRWRKKYFPIGSFPY